MLRAFWLLLRGGRTAITTAKAAEDEAKVLCAAQMRTRAWLLPGLVPSLYRLGEHSRMAAAWCCLVEWPHDAARYRLLSPFIAALSIFHAY